MKRQIAALWMTIVLLIVGTVPTVSGAANLYGDVDGNGVCATADVRLVMAHLVGRGALDAEQQALADYTEDGTLNSSDARAMLRAIADGDANKPYDPPVEEQDLLRASAYSGDPFVVLNDNIPLFTEAEKQQAKTTVFETYAPLDALGRCGTAYANVCRELMPTEDRESISSVTPTGWHNQQYDHVSGGWVYNRCHIIGFQLAGEQANKQNLITGTRYLNIEGMLPFENMVADYIKETDNHVLYRATPLFVGDNLLAEGVRIEAWSVEDGGEGIAFHVFCYNVQPGVTFDYATGENYADGTTPPVEDEDVPPTGTYYILNTNTKKFHYETCASAKKISEHYRADYTGSRDDLIADGYAPCGNCDP